MAKKSSASVPWTEDYLNELVAKGNIRSWKETGQRTTCPLPMPPAVGGSKGKPKKKATKPKAEAPEVVFMRTTLFNSGISFSEEHRFHTERMWRFDFSFEHGGNKYAAEYEGIVSGKSRHTSITGYTGDTDKYSAAAILGWRVLRYTALNFRKFAEDLQTILNSNGEK